MSDWYTEQLARARQYRFCADVREPRGRRYVGGKPLAPPMAEPEQRKAKVNGSTRAAAERDAERKRRALEAVRAGRM